MWCAGLLLYLLVVARIDARKTLKVRELSVLHDWDSLEFSFPSNETRDSAIFNRLYFKGNGIPVDFHIDYGKNSEHFSYRTFITIPRLTAGIPYSLAVFKNINRSKSPQMIPYPNYELHATHGFNCNGITSALRLFIDECNRLWVVDSGQVASMQFCPPQILAFDLNTDQLVHRYVIPDTQYYPDLSVFTTLLVDVRSTHSDNCDDTKIYLTDPWGFGLIVYDALNRISWRVEHDLMRPDANLFAGNSDGIFSASISPNTIYYPDRKLYFHALNSIREIMVPLSTVDNHTEWIYHPTTSSTEFQVLGERKIRCESEAMDSQGNLYCTLLKWNALVRWDGRSEYHSDNLKIYAHNPKQLKFVTSIKIVKPRHGEEEVWALSVDPKLFSVSQTDKNQIGFTISGCRIKELLNGQQCITIAT